MRSSIIYTCLLSLLICFASANAQQKKKNNWQELIIGSTWEVTLSDLTGRDAQIDEKKNEEIGYYIFNKDHSMQRLDRNYYERPDHYELVETKDKKRYIITNTKAIEVIVIDDQHLKINDLGIVRYLAKNKEMVFGKIAKSHKRYMHGEWISKDWLSEDSLSIKKLYLLDKNEGILVTSTDSTKGIWSLDSVSMTITLALGTKKLEYRIERFDGANDYSLVLSSVSNNDTNYILFNKFVISYSGWEGSPPIYPKIKQSKRLINKWESGADTTVKLFHSDLKINFQDSINFDLHFDKIHYSGTWTLDSARKIIVLQSQEGTMLLSYELFLMIDPFDPYNIHDYPLELYFVPPGERRAMHFYMKPENP